MNKKYAILYKNCLLVKGIKNSIICDLHLRRFLEIPSEHNDLLENFQKKSIKAVLHRYDEDSRKQINNFLTFLKDKDYIFFTDSLKQWAELDLQWFPRSTITNAIIDLNENHYFLINPRKTLNSLKTLNCRFVQFRFFNKEDISYERLVNLLKILNNTHLFSFEILIKFSSKIGIKKYYKLCDDFNKVNLILFDSKENIESNNPRLKILQINIIDEKNCGIVTKNLFEVNIKKFTESMQYNSCLNRKISIDQNGNIKNCPSMRKSFGNIKTHSLEKIVENLDFRKIWNLNKDKVEICKICQYRYVCTDCRAYVEDPDNLYSKPLKCGYDPYTNKWEEWSTNPLKKKAITYYKMDLSST